MPHDRDGNLLTVGDLVMLPCRVTQITMGEDFCNIAVETVGTIHLGYKPSILDVMNSKMFIKLQPDVPRQPTTPTLEKGI